MSEDHWGSVKSKVNKKRSLRDRALIFPADISIPGAYYKGYEDAIDELLGDLRYWLRQDDLDNYSSDYVLRDVESKWEAKKNE